MHVCACVVFVYEYSCLKIYKVTCKHTYVNSIVVSFEGLLDYACIEPYLVISSITNKHNPINLQMRPL